MACLISTALVSSAFAGQSPKEVMTEPAEPAPCLLSWFAGGSVGYLTELEEEMYHIMFGIDPCLKVGGWDVTFHAEIGYTRRQESYSAGTTFIPLPGNITLDDTFDLDDLEGGLRDSADTGLLDTDYELRMVPLTLNARFERQFYKGLGGYFGAGIGVAWVDLDADAGSFGTFRDNDWIFTAQIFAGLQYRLNEQFDVFSGIRWIYLDDADLGGGTLELDDDLLIELGVRFHF